MRYRSLRISGFFAATLICLAVVGAEPAGQSKNRPDATPWNVSKLSQPPQFQWVDQTSPVRSLLYTGEPYNDKPTHVFAYYATPGTLAGDVSKDQDLPAVVLVHGGGGTAFAEWAELWARRGYAAIAMDLAGCRPIEGKSPHRAENRTRLEDGGPDQGDDEKFGSIDKPLTEQWPYHAVADVIRAHSLLRSFPEVDAKRTAVTGISWGGYLTCIVAGVDNRFQAAVPVYGCGFLQQDSAWLARFAKMTPGQRDRWVRLWDPSQYLPAVTMPIFFVNGTNDFAYPLDSYMKSYAAVPGQKQVRITVKMPHGHQAGWAPIEIGLFVDHYLKHGPGLAQLDTVVYSKDRVRVPYTSAVKLTAATLYFTTDQGPVNQRTWNPQDAKIQDDSIVADLPPAKTTMWFVTATDERGAIVSTPVTLSPRSRLFANSLGMEMVQIDAGSFTMGDPKNGDFDERPAHRVTITQPFQLSATEVTNAQYEQFDAGHRQVRGKLGFSKGDDEAVVFVTWHKAVAFCQWLSKKEGKPYRLPTEAEWEYACRAGTTTPYWTGDELPRAFHKNVRNSWYPAPDRSSPKEVVSLTVAKTPPSPWGLYDMHGNVEEWCADWYGPYSGVSQLDPVGRVAGQIRVTRGGSHSTLLEYLRSANRSGMLPDDQTWLVGFRVAMGQPAGGKALPVLPTPLCQQNVAQTIPKDLRNGPDPTVPYFKGPRRYVKIPPGSEGPLFAKHNHDPAIVDCPNGDLLAIWYSCRTEPGRELGIAASRLRYRADEWEPASTFWDVPDRNDHAPAMWSDGNGKIYHFNGLSAAGTWGSLATVFRTSTDSGATWSVPRLIMPEHGLRHMPVESVFQTRDGAIVLPCDAVPGGDGGTSVHISKDAGQTWFDPSSDTSVPKFTAGGQGGSIAGIHAGVVQLHDGRLMALGRGNTIAGHMPMSISADMGKTWTYSASTLPPIGGNQRLVLMRLREGPLLLVSFTHDFFKYRLLPPLTPAMYVEDAAGKKRRIFGMFAALSFDDGKTWPVRKPITPGGKPRTLTDVTLTGTVTFDATHAEPRGYLSGCQAPNGIVHIISSGLHYAFNMVWVTNPIAPVRDE